MAPIAISPPTSPSFSPAPSLDWAAYDHVHWYVGNAKQAAAYYVSRFGFARIAYRGLETGSRTLASHVIRNGRVIFVLSSPLRCLAQGSNYSKEEEAQLKEIHAHLEKHGDAVKDVAFEVDSVDDVFAAAVHQGAQAVSNPSITRDNNGKVKMATIKTSSDTTHTLVERKSYSGVFLPGYRSENGRKDPLQSLLPPVNLDTIDHVVFNFDWNQLDDVCD